MLEKVVPLENHVHKSLTFPNNYYFLLFNSFFLVPTDQCHLALSQSGSPECHYKVIGSTILDVPEEKCHLDTRPICRNVTRLIRKPLPQQPVCKSFPKEVCHVSISTKSADRQDHRLLPIELKWCTVRPTTTNKPPKGIYSLLRPLKGDYPEHFEHREYLDQFLSSRQKYGNHIQNIHRRLGKICLLYTSDAADE